MKTIVLWPDPEAWNETQVIGLITDDINGETKSQRSSDTESNP